jgi:hypothetical protein
MNVARAIACGKKGKISEVGRRKSGKRGIQEVRYQKPDVRKTRTSGFLAFSDIRCLASDFYDSIPISYVDGLPDEA